MPKFTYRNQPNFVTFNLQRTREDYMLAGSQFTKDLYKREQLINHLLWRFHAQEA